MDIRTEGDSITPFLKNQVDLTLTGLIRPLRPERPNISCLSSLTKNRVVDETEKSLSV